ncbi:unnamed protein product [Lactuca saligna]|uniref:Glycine dehydrogenase C-terminal domain-containing protein n=1 Tax=Lactuca saligna TaxID=75948 RepID=A0AA35Y5V2_LACSI|nr:unnamed protein product [Lactuca saligna]
MCGMKIITVGTKSKGNINIEKVCKAAEANKEYLSALMVTYPSTHGVYEEGIDDICKIIHDNGGQVYMDGANMYAQVGLTSPRWIGVDVCHLNIHKTFCIRHGGGGPGMGPIGVKKHLAAYLPSHPVVATGGIPAPEQSKPLGTISATPWGSTLILPISYTYIAMMGSHGLTNSSNIAILNANYMAKRLESHYPILFRGLNGTVAHEFLRPLKAELDKFCVALISIRQEIAEIVKGTVDINNNVIKGAPHPLQLLMADKWTKSYSREYAAYPAPWLRAAKFWPTTWISEVLVIDDKYASPVHIAAYLLSQVALSNSRCYIKLYDSPSKSSIEKDDDLEKLPASQKKKLRQKQRKDEARAKKEVEVKSEEVVGGVSKSGIRNVKPVDQDQHGEKLLQTEDPLMEAGKYLKLLQKHSFDSLETHLLSFEVNMQKQKIVLALQALKELQRLEAGNPDSHRCLIRFFHKMALRPAPVTDGEKLIFSVLEAERPTFRLLNGFLITF